MFLLKKGLICGVSVGRRLCGGLGLAVVTVMWGVMKDGATNRGSAVMLFLLPISRSAPHF